MRLFAVACARRALPFLAESRRAVEGALEAAERVAEGDMPGIWRGLLHERAARLRCHSHVEREAVSAARWASTAPWPVLAEAMTPLGRHPAARWAAHAAIRPWFHWAGLLWREDRDMAERLWREAYARERAWQEAELRRLLESAAT